MTAVLILFCFSCDKNETIDDSKTEIWKPLLTSIRHNSSIEIQWLNPAIYDKVLRPFTYIDPEAFEIYMSEENPDILKKIATLTSETKYEIKNLTNGQIYFIAVKALKKRKRTSKYFIADRSFIVLPLV